MQQYSFVVQSFIEYISGPHPGGGIPLPSPCHDFFWHKCFSNRRKYKIALIWGLRTGVARFFLFPLLNLWQLSENLGLSYFVANIFFVGYKLQHKARCLKLIYRLQNSAYVRVQIQTSWRQWVAMTTGLSFIQVFRVWVYTLIVCENGTTTFGCMGLVIRSSSVLKRSNENIVTCCCSFRFAHYTGHDVTKTLFFSHVIYYLKFS